jgi:hypothetical protein
MGAGTTFYIYLPAIESETPADDHETAKPAKGQKKVQVIEDARRNP